MAYIYKITNLKNNKCYIGKTLKSIEKRWEEHCHDYLRRNEEKRPLYSAMKKYGTKNFKVEEIEQCNENIVNEREKYWIEYYDSFKKGYNATLGGDGKAYIDRELVIKTYNEVQNVRKTADLLNIDAGNLSKILKENNVTVKSSQQIMIDNFGKSIAMLDLDGNVLKTFVSLTEAAKYIKQQTGSTAQEKGMIIHISQVAQGKRKTAYKYKWKFI